MKWLKRANLFEMKRLRIVVDWRSAVPVWVFALGVLTLGLLPQTALAAPRACIPPGDRAQCSRDSQCCDGSVCAGRCRRGCKIDRVFYDNGAINPQNDCQWCQAATNRFVWTNRASGAACGDQTTDECTNPDTCNGSGACLDNHEPTTTTCGDAEGQCTNQDYCDGSGGCTDNEFKPDSTSCTGASQGDECDDDPADHCTGTDGSCVDEFKAGGTSCGDSGTQCRNQDTCDGLGGDCIDNGFKVATTSCTGASQGDQCDDDAADHCTGTSNSCVDVFKPSGTFCGDSGSPCRNQDTCDGLGGDCTDNGFKSATTACGDQTNDQCNNPDHCSGTDNNCLPDYEPAGAACGDAEGPCIYADACDGAGGCTNAGFKPETTRCTGTANSGLCDDNANDHCDGNGACVDALRPSSHVCASDTGPNGEYLCRDALRCSGTSSLCPSEDPAIIDVTLSWTSQRVCRPSTGPCDPEEYCNGLNSCSPQALLEPGHECPGAGPCEKPYQCDNYSNCVPTGFLFDATCDGGPRDGQWCDYYAESVLGQPQCVPGGTCVKTVCREGTSCERPWTCDAGGRCLTNGFLPAGTDCIGELACEKYSCDASGDCVDQNVTRNGSASCRAPANECDQRDFCGNPSVVPSNGRSDFEDYPNCGPDVKQPWNTPCTYHPLGEDAPGLCMNGECHPHYCKNSIECPDGWVCGCPPGLVCPNSYCVPAPSDGGYGDVCSVRGYCNLHSDSGGLRCESDAVCNQQGNRPDAKCLQSYCDVNSGVRQGVGCASDSDCRYPGDQDGLCIIDTRGTCGSIPDSTFDYVCCAGMAGDGLGGRPALGVIGRCQECCGSGGAPDQKCRELEAPDGTTSIQCCDGKCTDVIRDIHNCLSCNYDSVGVDCTGLISTCSPGVVECDETADGCVMEEYCADTAEQNGWIAASCDLPQVQIPVPHCDFCVAPLTLGIPCLTDADCGVADGAQPPFPGPFAICLPGEDCRVLNGITSWCYHDPSSSCVSLRQEAYVTVTGTPICTETGNEPNVGDECDSDADCRGGTICKTTCDLSHIWDISFCFTTGPDGNFSWLNPTCQW